MAKNGSMKADDPNNPMVAKVNECIREMINEKQQLDQSKTPHAARLLDQELTKVQQSGRLPSRDQKYIDIYREKPVKVTVKVLVPVREHPKFNFVGKILGPKGNSLKRLQEETMCKMAVLGRGSMRDRQKEEECRTSLDPKYSHLTDELHVEISAIAPPAEAHARIAYALAEVRKFLIPDNNDNIHVEQMREMEMGGGGGEMPFPPKRPMMGPSRPVPRPPPMQMRPPPRGAPPANSPRGVVPAKTKIMSILDRARAAMEDSYGAGGGYDDSYDPAEPTYDSYSGPPGPRGGGGGGFNSSYDDSYDSSGYGRQGGGGGGFHSEGPPQQRWKQPFKGPAQGNRLGNENPRFRATPYMRPAK